MTRRRPIWAPAVAVAVLLVAVLSGLTPHHSRMTVEAGVAALPEYHPHPAAPAFPPPAVTAAELDRAPRTPARRPRPPQDRPPGRPPPPPPLRLRHRHPRPRGPPPKRLGLGPHPAPGARPQPTLPRQCPTWQNGSSATALSTRPVDAGS